MRPIDGEVLYNQTAEWEARALDYVGKLNEQEGNDKPSLEWRIWTAILGERASFKYDVMDAPTIDAVPVVRCKDCKWHSKKKYWTNEGIIVRYWCSYFEVLVSDNHYCSRGERREINED